VKTDEHKPGTISLSIAQVQKHGAAISDKLRGAVTKIRRRSTVAPLPYISPHEYLARGWDANNNEWRSVLWPALDKNFRAADPEGTSPIWKIQSPWMKDRVTIGKSIPTTQGATPGTI
jgi:hypothetical protein